MTIPCALHVQHTQAKTCYCRCVHDCTHCHQNRKRYHLRTDAMINRLCHQTDKETRSDRHWLDCLLAHVVSAEHLTKSVNKLSFFTKAKCYWATEKGSLIPASCFWKVSTGFPKKTFRPLNSFLCRRKETKQSTPTVSSTTMTKNCQWGGIFYTWKRVECLCIPPLFIGCTYYPGDPAMYTSMHVLEGCAPQPSRAF